MLEWRLHPTAGYEVPGLSHYDLWEKVVGQLEAGAGRRGPLPRAETRPLEASGTGWSASPPTATTWSPPTSAAAATRRPRR